MLEIARVGDFGVIGSAIVGWIHIKFDDSSVFVAILGEVFAVFDIFLVVVK